MGERHCLDVADPSSKRCGNKVGQGCHEGCREERGSQGFFIEGKLCVEKVYDERAGNDQRMMQAIGRLTEEPSPRRDCPVQIDIPVSSLWLSSPW